MRRGVLHVVETQIGRGRYRQDRHLKTGLAAHDVHAVVIGFNPKRGDHLGDLLLCAGIQASSQQEYREHVLEDARAAER